MWGGASSRSGCSRAILDLDLQNAFRRWGGTPCDEPWRGKPRRCRRGQAGVTRPPGASICRVASGT
eukprot:6254956-Alexandrium_andersonii.AAC.1